MSTAAKTAKGTAAGAAGEAAEGAAQVSTEAPLKIHAVQPFGALIAVASDWTVSHFSANLADFLHCKAEPHAGMPLSRIISQEAIDALASRAEKLAKPDMVERLFDLRLTRRTDRFEVAIHRSRGSLIIEIEPQCESGLDHDLVELREITEKFASAACVRSLCDVAVERARDLLGYERIMLYKFREDDSGEVIAESKLDGIAPYLGLRYPALDIPPKARALFMRKKVRILADIDGGRIPICTAPSEAMNPLDLSLSVLRAHSEIHTEYMRGLGAQAALSIAVIVRGKLWGLFACHHNEPRVPSHSRRTIAELISEVFSLGLERLLNLEEAALDRRGQSLHDTVMRSFADGKSFEDLLPSLAPIIGDVIAFDGMSHFSSESFSTAGSAPTKEQFETLLPALSQMDDGGVIAARNLGELIPEARNLQEQATGALIIPISRAAQEYLVLWRREQVETVTWAGKPAQESTQPSGTKRSAARTDFTAWTEEIRGMSASWSGPEVNLAMSLRSSLIEVVLKLSDLAMQERIKAQKQQDVLIAELNHRVRNILNLIRGLINQSRRDASEIDDFAELIGGRINALANAHDNITRENWSAASLHALIRAEAEAYVSSELNRISILGEDVLITPEAYTVLALVLHEMTTNSVKYGALSNRKGRLTIHLSERDGGLHICWKESGGPKVKPPKRRGFGSTIIENSLPFELKGTAVLSFDDQGLTGEFWIPGDYASFTKPNGGVTARKTKHSPIRKEIKDVVTMPEAVLLVEDSMIIALEAQDNLLRLGIGTVDIESSVAGALERLRQKRYALAILDFNLGTENSAPVTEELRKADIPFWLATGYGELDGAIEEMGAEAVLTKPYGTAELAHVLSAFAQLAGPVPYDEELT